MKKFKVESVDKFYEYAMACGLGDKFLDEYNKLKSECDSEEEADRIILKWLDKDIDRLKWDIFRVYKIEYIAITAIKKLIQRSGYIEKRKFIDKYSVKKCPLCGSEDVLYKDIKFKRNYVCFDTFCMWCHNGYMEEHPIKNIKRGDMRKWKKWKRK